MESWWVFWPLSGYLGWMWLSYMDTAVGGPWESLAWEIATKVFGLITAPIVGPAEIIGGVMALRFVPPGYRWGLKLW